MNKLKLYTLLFFFSLSIIRSTDEAIRSFFTKSWYDIQTMSDSEFDTIFNSPENQKKLFACRIEMLEKSIIELKKNQRRQDHAKLIEAQNNYNKLIESIDLLLEKQVKRITFLSPELYLLLLPSQAVKHIDVNLRRALLSDREKVSTIFQLLKQMQEKEGCIGRIFLSKEDVNFIPSDLLDFDFLLKRLSLKSVGFIEQAKIKTFFTSKENVDKLAALLTPENYNHETICAIVFLNHLTAIQLNEVIEYLPVEIFPALGCIDFSELNGDKLSQTLTEDRQKEIYEYCAKYNKSISFGFLKKLNNITPELFSVMYQQSICFGGFSSLGISIKDKNIEEKVNSVFKKLSQKNYLEKIEKDVLFRKQIRNSFKFLYNNDYQSLQKQTKKYKVDSLFKDDPYWDNTDYRTEILFGTFGVVGLGFLIRSFLKMRQNKLKPKPNPVHLKPNLVHLKPIMKISPSIKSF